MRKSPRPAAPPVSRWPQPLGEAVEVLYAAFAHFPLKPRLDMCEHCEDSRDDKILHAAPLRELSADQVGYYAFCAMTTMGDAADYRHFLPRILELSLSRNIEPGLEPWLITSKLRYECFGELAAPELDALTAFNRALWFVLLSMSPADTSGFLLPNAPLNLAALAWNAEDVLRLGANVTGCLPQLLEAWKPRESKAHLWHFAELVLHNHDCLGPNDTPFDQIQNSDARAALRAWILDAAKLRSLERAAYDDLDSPWAEPCDRAAQALRPHVGDAGA